MRQTKQQQKQHKQKQKQHRTKSAEKSYLIKICDQQGCQFRGKEAQQGICHTTDGDLINWDKLEAHEKGIVAELAVPGGSIDYCLVSVRDGKPRDFVGIELQTLDTTGTVWPERQRFLQQHLAAEE